MKNFINRALAAKKNLNELQSYLTRLRGLMLTLIILCSVGSGNVWGTTLTENFYTSSLGNTYGNNSSLSTASNRSSFDYTWGSGTGTVFQNGIKLGSGSATGSTTCSDILSGIPTGVTFTVKVYAAVWGSDGGQVRVSYNGTTTNQASANSAISNPSSVTYNSSHFSSANSFEFTKAKNVAELTISSTKNRLIVDKIEVVYSSGYTVVFLNTAQSNSKALIIAQFYSFS